MVSFASDRKKTLASALRHAGWTDDDLQRFLLGAAVIRGPAALSNESKSETGKSLVKVRALSRVANFLYRGPRSRLGLGFQIFFMAPRNNLWHEVNS